MQTQQLSKTPILINQHPIATPKPVIINSDALSIKKSIVAPFSAMKVSYLYIGGAIIGVLLFIYKKGNIFKVFKKRFLIFLYGQY